MTETDEDLSRLVHMLNSHDGGAYRDSEAVQNLAELVPLVRRVLLSPAAHLYEKCQHCHLFVSPEDVECSSTGDGCTCGWRPSRHLQLVRGQYTEAESEQYSAEYLAHTPQTYVHLHRGDDVDNGLDESHEPTPSGRKANLLTWKTYGPLAMRERFTS